MSTIVFYREVLTIPPWVVDLTSFRRWATSDESPDNVPVFFLAGEVWIDMSKEQIFTHNRPRTEISRVLANLVKQTRDGSFYSEGVLVANEDADLSGNPDGVYVANDSLLKGRVRLVEGVETGFVELEGSPDMVLEVVSDSSVEKDTQILRELYWKAGIREYWLVDARGDRPQFDILRRTNRGYSATPKTGGWIKSAVFRRSFRLTRKSDALGHPEFTLDVR